MEKQNNVVLRRKEEPRAVRTMGNLQCQGDHAGLYKYKKAIAEGKSPSEAKRISQTKTKK